jgi:hypothetical protein
VCLFVYAANLEFIIMFKAQLLFWTISVKVTLLHYFKIYINNNMFLNNCRIVKYYRFVDIKEFNLVYYSMICGH